MESENAGNANARGRAAEEASSQGPAAFEGEPLRDRDEEGRDGGAAKGERVVESWERNRRSSEQRGWEKPEPEGEGGVKDLIRRHKLAASLVAILAIAAVAGAIIWWLSACHYETTDDAFIDGRPVAVSTQVAGAFVSVPVTDNELVQPGRFSRASMIAIIAPRSTRPRPRPR
jgi:membrane fusion protein (multidrug efflux system)